MLTLVLSGGSNYGAVRAGALEVLFAADLRPQMIVCASAEALSAARSPKDEPLKLHRPGWAPTRDHVLSRVPEGLRPIRANWPIEGKQFLRRVSTCSVD